MIIQFASIQINYFVLLVPLVVNIPSLPTTKDTKIALSAL